MIKTLQLRKKFYATVQNNMHYAVHGRTTDELIVERSDHTKYYKVLTTWADGSEGKIKKSDVTIAKNYLSLNEINQLNSMVTVYLDFAENMTLRHISITIQNWGKRLNNFRKYLIMVFCRMLARSHQKLQNFMLKLNLKNTVSCRTKYSCLTLISICWNWKIIRKNNCIIS